jgi:hypothetical protein
VLVVIDEVDFRHRYAAMAVRSVSRIPRIEEAAAAFEGV